MSVILIAVASGIGVWLGPSDVRLDTAAAVLSVRVRAECRSPARSAFGPDGIGCSRWRIAAGTDSPLMTRSCRSHVGRVRRRSRCRELARQAGSGRLVWRDLVVRPRPSPRAAPGVDLREPDADGPGAAVADRGVRRLDRRPADRDSEGRAMGAVAPARPTLEGTGAGVRAAVQPPHARERHRGSSRCRACRPSCWASSRRWRFRAPSSRAICSSWATPAPASRR